MANDTEPLIKFEPGGKAPVLNYNVPEPTAYSGRNFIALDFSADYFKPNAFERPIRPDEPTKPPIPPIPSYEFPTRPQGEISPNGTPPEVPHEIPDIDLPPKPGSGRHIENRRSVTNLELTEITNLVEKNMKSGFADRRLFPNAQLTSGNLRFIGKTNPGFEVNSTIPVSPKLEQLDPGEVSVMMKEGKRLNIYRSLFGTLTYNYIPEPDIADAQPRILLVETYRLSSYLGSYGAGRTVKTFTLLPGEKTKISVRTFLKTETERKSASSILDSFSQESADDFEQSLQEEQTDKTTGAESFEYHAEAEAKASWGWGSAKVSGGVKGGTSSSREEFAKNVSNATEKHTSKSSAKRDVEINTSYEVKETEEEETTIERELENINLSRTLNFVFRQMNQEFISVLSLTDVRVAFFNGYAETRKEVTLPQIDSLLDEFIVDEPDKRNFVRQNIVDALENVLDFKDEFHNVVEEMAIDQENPYLRFKKDLISVYKDEVTGTEFTVPGIILAATKNVLRTEGVLVEALMGEGEALDGYAKRLQELEVTRREAAVARESAEAERAALLNQLVKESDIERSKLLADLTCPCRSDSPPLSVSIDSKDHKAEES